jgi:hypothetical protein
MKKDRAHCFKTDFISGGGKVSKIPGGVVICVARRQGGIFLKDAGARPKGATARAPPSETEFRMS